MPSVDTNVVVRLLVADDPDQSARATAVFESEAVELLNSVILETGWVLTSAYGVTPREASAALRRLCGLPNVSVEAPARIAEALDLVDRGLDFGDAMHLAGAGDGPFLTFDRRLIRRGTEAGRDVRAP